MHKSEFVSSFSDKYGILREDAHNIITKIFQHMREQLLKGETVRIDDVGRFGFKFRKAGMRNNNLTGENIQVSPRVRMKFTSFQVFQDLLNEGLAVEMQKGFQTNEDDDDDE